MALRDFWVRLRVPRTRHERGRCNESTSSQETNKKALAIHVSGLLYDRRAFMIDGRSATPRLPANITVCEGQLDANQRGRSVGQAWRDGSPKYMAAMEPRAI